MGDGGAVATWSSIAALAGGYIGQAGRGIWHRRVSSQRERQVSQELLWAVAGRPADQFNAARPGLLQQVATLNERMSEHEVWHRDYCSKGAAGRTT